MCDFQFMGLNTYHVQALTEELRDIRSGPNKFENETRFIMKATHKKPNGRNQFDISGAYFEDVVQRYEDIGLNPAPFLLHTASSQYSKTSIQLVNVWLSV